MSIASTDGNTLYPVNESGPRKIKLKLTGRGPLLGRVFDMAAREGIKQLWILPGCALYLKLQKIKVVPDAEHSGWTIRPSDAPRNMMTAWRMMPEKQTVYLFAPGLKAEQWALDKVTDAAVWRDVHRIFRSHLKIGPTIPIRTARVLAENRVNTAWLSPRPESLQPFIDNVESDLAWRRELDARDSACAWLHVYDKSNMYLSGASTALGVGDTYELRRENQHLTFNKKIPALWHAEIWTQDLNTGVAAALDVLRPNWKKKEVNHSKVNYFEGWFYTPTLRYFTEQNYGVRINRVVMYRDSHRVMERFYDAVREGLRSIPGDAAYSTEARAVALKMLKACYTQFFGWLGHDPGARFEPWYRPDWRHFIIAESKARVAHNVQRVYQLTRIRPVGIRVDSVMYFSDEPDPQKAIPPPFSGPSAAYRCKYSIAGEVARELLTNKGLSIQTVDNELYRASRGLTMEIKKRKRKEK